ncbi:MAG: 50S ribosomal protein L6 [Candidatus Methanomethylicaceae archaeon]
MANSSLSIKIPEGVEISMQGSSITVSGPKGAITKDFAHSGLRLNKTEDQIVLTSFGTGKKSRAMLGTIASHIKNMFKGVKNGHTYTMKIVYAHFPITVKVAGKELFIENFMGERSKRVAKIVGNVKITVNGDEIILEGIDKEEVGQTAANIHLATHVKKMDPRVFQDGIYLVERR